MMILYLVIGFTHLNTFNVIGWNKNSENTEKVVIFSDLTLTFHLDLEI